MSSQSEDKGLGQMIGLLKVSDLLGGLITVHDGHLYVHEDQFVLSITGRACLNLIVIFYDNINSLLSIVSL